MVNRYSEFMQWISEHEILLNDEFKTQIFSRSKPEIERQIIRSQKFPIEERAFTAFGRVFETLALNEEVAKRPETEKQKEIRVIIQQLFQDAEIVLGENWPRKPDFVSVVFDKFGHLVIDEIVEIKTSRRALDHGLEKGQPDHAVMTIEKIVELVNLMVRTDNFNNMDLIKGLTGRYDQYRKSLLKKAFHKIKESNITEELTFSEDLRYHVIYAENESDTRIDFQVHQKGKPINVVITKSQFSKRDVHDIIDHFAETPETKAV